MNYLCPICQAPLVMQEKSFVCLQQHRFDKAKQGYINLLPVQHKGSKDPGDNREMMQARRLFLEHGHYQPLRDAVSSQLMQREINTLLDIGCGEGYYTASFAQISGETWGLDVSKTAIRLAAKRYPQVKFCVASSQRLPFAENSFDAVVRVFAPCNPSELLRVIKKTGRLITVVPGERHLFELKSLIYQDVKLHNTEPEHLAGFIIQQTQKISWQMTLGADDAVALLQMTPFAWRASPEVWQLLRNKSIFHCEADFTVQVWQAEN